MGAYIKGMEMPTTGLYFVSVDNSNGRDKTVVTVERMLGNRDVRQIVGSFELVPVQPHGRLIDGDSFLALINDSTILSDFLKCIINPLIRGEPTVIEAEEG